MIGTPERYLERVKGFRPKAFVGGEEIKDVLSDPNTKPIINTVAKTYELASDPRFKEVMTAESPLIGEGVSRLNHLAGTVDDLEMRLELTRLMTQTTGTCCGRCGGCSGLNTLAATTYAMKRDGKGEYHGRFMDYLKWVHQGDLSCHAATTSPKGDRSRSPKEQDPDLHLRVVEKRRDGIVLRGAKAHQTSAIGVDEMIVYPGLFNKGEEAYAVACAVPNSAEGLTYFLQYNSDDAERRASDDISTLGNPLYGGRQTMLVVYEDVFVPWERVFMCGEVEYTKITAHAAPRTHIYNEGPCKAGFGDLILGAAMFLAESNGLDKKPHIVEDLVKIIAANETAYASAVVAARKGSEFPAGSGVFFADGRFSVLSKLNANEGFFEVMKAASDIAGGLLVTMPSEKELRHFERGALLLKYLKGRSDIPTKERMRMFKFLNHYVASPHAAQAWIGGGAPYHLRMALYEGTDMDGKKALARALAFASDPHG
jgi:4-hydroxybutyryl-CoA dehydratase / vinylacetyl-CoA-Delta-isomerase